MRIRYASFDVDGLKRVAARAAGADRCSDATRPPKVTFDNAVFDFITCQIGSFNKNFLLTFDNSKMLIAKIFCPPVTPRRLCTASEVATMDNAKNIGKYNRKKFGGPYPFQDDGHPWFLS